jgi:hypothetical protein
VALGDFEGNPNHWTVLTWFDGEIVRQDTFTSYRTASAYAVGRASRPDRYGAKWVKENRHKVKLAPPDKTNTFLMGDKKGGYSLIQFGKITRRFLSANTYNPPKTGPIKPVKEIVIPKSVTDQWFEENLR